MARVHVLIAVGLLVTGACASAQRPSRDPAASPMPGGNADARVGEAPREVADGRGVAAREQARASAPELQSGSESEPPGEVPGRESAADAAPQSLVQVIAACRRVQDRDLPVGCRTEFIDGVFTLMVGFESAADAAKYSGLEAQLSMPFCEAANQVGAEATLFVLVADSARQFDCELEQWGAWFELVAEAGRVPKAVN